MYCNNKAIAHNIFAIPVVTPTFGILNWTKEELEQIDIKTRKLLTSSGSFHRNSDVDRLYTERSKGGRGLNSLVDTFIARIVSISQHLKEHASSNQFLAAVLKHEEKSLIRVANGLSSCFEIDPNETDSPKHPWYATETKDEREPHQSMDSEDPTWLLVSNTVKCERHQ